MIKYARTKTYNVYDVTICTYIHNVTYIYIYTYVYTDINCYVNMLSSMALGQVKFIVDSLSQQFFCIVFVRTWVGAALNKKGYLRKLL